MKRGRKTRFAGRTRTKGGKPSRNQRGKIRRLKRGGERVGDSGTKTKSRKGNEKEVQERGLRW